MAPSGRRPKPPGQTVTRHRRAHDWVEVEATPFADGPRLPSRRRHGKTWPAGIAEKWIAWSTMPHCRLWAASDWHFALDTLELAAIFYDTGHLATATELRYREKVLATTFDARNGQRLRYVAPASVPRASVVALDEFRDL